MNRDNVARAGWGLVASTLSFGVLALTAGSASAHVGITPSTTAAGAYAVLDVSVPHGCESSPTTEITIKIPDQINSVTPTRNPLWDVKKQVVALNPPVTDGHGNQITERVASVTYTANKPLPDGYRDVFELSLQLPDAEGDTLVFPVLQACKQGQSAWIEVAADGQGDEDLALPAPTVVLTAATADDHHGASSEEIVATSDETATSADSGGSDALTISALGFGVLGALLGGTALVRQRRRA